MPIDIFALRDFGARYAAAWCSQDAASVAAFFSAHGTLAINGGASSLGREAIAQVVQSFMSAFPDMQVLMDDLVINNGVPEFHWTLLGTNTGHGGSGKRARIRGFEEWQIGEDGLIASSLGHFDTAEYARQLEQGYEVG